MKLSNYIPIVIATVFFAINTYGQEYESSDEYFDDAKRNVEQQNFSNAARLSLKGLKLAPNDLDLKILLGKSYLELGRYDSSRFVLKQVYEKRRKDITVLRYLVNVEQTTKRYSDAICYVNELLEITPYSRGWWRRKIAIYKEMGNYEEAERALKRIQQIYPDDKELQEEYNYIMIGDGTDATKNKKYDEANQIYKTVIDYNPSNKEAYMGIIKNEMLKGNKEEALIFTNRALLELPEDRGLVEKKIGLLEDMGRYDEAINYIQTLPAVFDDIKKNTMPYLMQESARYNEYNDPYTLNKKLYDMNGNSNSLNYVINNALGKGYYIDAEFHIKKALKRNPNSKTLLVKEMELYRATKDTDKFEKSVLNLHEKFPNDTDIKYAYDELMYNRGKRYIQEKRYSEALTIFQDLTSSPDFTKGSEQQIFSIFLLQNRFDEATEQIDKLIQLDPNNADYLLKKSTLYQKMELYDDALEITRNLETQYPLNRRYPVIYVSQTEEYATYLMREGLYSRVLPVVEDGLTRDEDNKLLLNLAINASSAIPNYPKGIQYGQQALQYYPNNKNFKLKLSNMYSLNKEFDNSVAILDSLKLIYKYDRKIKNALGEVLFYKAKDQEEQGLIDEALINYDSAYALNVEDKGAMMRLINLHITERPYEESLDFINEKLKRTPNDNFLRYKKGVVFELLKQYDSAYYYQKYRELDNPYEQQQWNVYLESLGATQLKNELAATYLRASSDSVAFSTALASINYRHFYDKVNTFGLDLNYAARRSGVAFQIGPYYSRVFSPTLYADVGLLFGGQFFPSIKLYGNAYKAFKNDYVGSLGVSWARVNNNANSTNEINYFTITGGVTKTWDDVSANVKLSIMRDDLFFYSNLMASGRFTLNPRGDYLSLILSGGSAPFDQQVQFQQNTFSEFINTMIGAGYKHFISPKTAILIDGTWYNFATRQNIYTNQYNLGLTIITKF
ncbi:MAG: hypothetical protein CMB99_11995 [Flavobacteriaceae bacterium]|nr:hypothetical protein [Flavobacteriaceae bacterium]|tara:strand:- start:154598 stop:157474 length:2877 start_codon:yes stop_codon:yes gene_type:complete